MAFCVWVFSFYIWFSLSIHVIQESVLNCSWWLNDNLLYGYTIFCLSVYWLRAIWVISAFWLMNIALMNIHVQVFVWIHALMSPWVYNYGWNCYALCLTFFKLFEDLPNFPIAAAPFCIPISHAWGLQFLHILGHTCYCPFFFFFFVFLGPHPQHMGIWRFAG